ncbi:unnamed protein product [Sphenostylis stenocarpa]|uniref:Uncharacterized protein n=1 Tax=Sphenostylis stenocarpa TaxID=92480 RepID=A0AA86TRB5_9FABA|nr:unnamed protein product [Sphenostylis stenocarpa]
MHSHEDFVKSSVLSRQLGVRSRAMMAMVVGDRCNTDLGICHGKANCKSKCSVIYQGGQGLCEQNGDCHDIQCNSDCAFLFPGKGTTGYCFSKPETNYANCYQNELEASHLKTEDKQIFSDLFEIVRIFHVKEDIRLG